jgi:voltage-gated potassium channel
MEKRKIVLSLSFLFFIVCLGVIGYHLIEKYTFLNSLYMTIITLTTVGFGEVKPLSYYGKVFTMMLAISGVATVAYVFSQIVEFLINVSLQNKLLKGRKLMKEIKSHFIICGFGRMGKEIADELKKMKINFVVIEENEDERTVMEEKEILYILEDATKEDVLLKANIKEAKGIICVCDTDAENVFITLSARSLNPNIHIISRASSGKVETSLKKAGADKVFSPYTVGAKRMAACILKPNVVEFLDLIMHSQEIAFLLEELKISKGNLYIGKTLKEADIRKRTGVSVLGIKKKDNSIISNPSSNSLIEEGDILIALGTEEQLRKMEEECQVK